MTSFDPYLPPSLARQRVGSWLSGKWRLDGVIGAGGMGVVYEARHRNGKRVAIKLLHPELMLRGDVLRRFLREGYLANAVEHPGVVSVLDDGVTDEGLPFLVMEFLEGENLDARLNRLGRPLALPDVVAIGLAMLDVLALTHAAGVIHRDIKPENVFLTSAGGVKLLDFGIAYLIDTAGSMSSTRPGVAVGTPTFMPREQAQGLGGKVDGQSDLWSVGATLYFALSTEFLYEAGSVTAFLQQLLEVDPRPLRSLVPAIPEPIARVVHGALQHDRALRWKTAGDMRAALCEAAAEAGIQIPPTPSLEGYATPALRTSLASLSDEMEANLNERLSLPFPKPINSNPLPALRGSTPASLRQGLSSAETLPGLPTPTSNNPDDAPPRSSRNSPPVISSIPPAAPSRSYRWALPAVFVLLGLAGGRWLWSPKEPAPAAASPSIAPLNPSENLPATPAPSAVTVALPDPSASSAPSAVPAASASSSAPLKKLGVPPKTSPTAPSKPAGGGDDDLGSYRN